MSKIIECSLRRELSRTLAQAVRRSFVAKAAWEAAVRRDDGSAKELAENLGLFREDERRANIALQQHIVEHGCAPEFGVRRNAEA